MAILLYELVTERVVFSMMSSVDDVAREICSRCRPDFPAHDSGFCANLIQQCWHTDPKMRPTFREIVAQADGFKLEGCDELEFNEYRHEILKLP
jgi:hypothetical protein